MKALGCERSRSSTKETGYHCAVQEKGGTSVSGGAAARGEGEGAGGEAGEEEGEEGEEASSEEGESGGAVAAAPAAAAEETEGAAAAAAAAAPLLGVAQTTLLLCGTPRARRSRKRPRGVVFDGAVIFVTVVVALVAMGTIGAPWRRKWARIVAVCAFVA